MDTNLVINKKYSFEKTGIKEIQGLEAVMRKVMTPVLTEIKDRIYWNDDLALEDTEYKSRDGFIPYSHNCGGIEISLIIPKCESYEFDFLEYGECDECNGETQCGYNGQECAAESEGHLDAKLRVWFKFEGLENGEMSFYLYLGGGNGDAPYFRTKHEATIFETQFTAKTLKQVETKGTAAVKKLLKAMA